MWGKLVSYIISIIISLNVFFGIGYLMKRLLVNPLQVIAQVEVPLDDVFQLFFKSPGDAEFTQGKSIRTSVDGSEGLQSVHFRLPNDFSYDEIRFDLGDNPQQSRVRLEKISFHYGQRSFEISDSLFDYFPKLHQIDTADGYWLHLNQTAIPHDPFLVSHNVSRLFSMLNHRPSGLLIAQLIALALSIPLFIYLFLFVDFRPYPRNLQVS